MSLPCTFEAGVHSEFLLRVADPETIYILCLILKTMFRQHVYIT